MSIIAYAHERLANVLDRVANEFSGFQRQTIVIRNPDKPQEFILVSNEPDEVQKAVIEAMYAQAQHEEVVRG